MVLTPLHLSRGRVGAERPFRNTLAVFAKLHGLRGNLGADCLFLTLTVAAFAELSFTHGSVGA